MRPLSVRSYIATIAALAVASSAALFAVTEQPFVERPLLVAVVALLIAAEHLFSTRIAHGLREGETTTHEEAYIVFLALLEPAVATAAAVVLGFLVGNVVTRRPPLKAFFNVAATAAAIVPAMLVIVALGGANERTARAAAAALAGVVVFAVLNRALLSGVLALVGAARFRTTLLDDAGARVLLLATNAALGVLAGIAALESVWTLALALGALVVLHFTLAGHGRARAEREKLRDVIDASSNGILVVDARGSVVSWSLACTEITGYTPEEICGLPLRDVRALLDAQPYDVAHAVPGKRYATRIRTKGGELRWLIISRAQLPEGGDLLVVHDDTARRTLDELTAAQLEERTRADLVASVSHEFRTPLTNILGFTATLLHRRVSDDDRERFLTIVHEQAERLRALVDDLLDLRAMDALALELQTERFDLADVARHEAAAFAGPTPRSIEVIGAELPLPVRADRRRIEQVLANLLSNALKYSPPGAPVAVELAADPSGVRVSVRDEGFGIAPEHHDRVFTPFFRADDVRAAGTGLGLAIARQIVVLHGGTIEFTSEPGSGSEFTFTLPRDRER